MRCSPFFLIACALVTAAPLAAQRGNGDWCRDGDWSRDSERVCEVREFSLSASQLRVDAGTNGGVDVQGESRGDVRVEARIQAHAGTLDRARALIDQVEVSVLDGRVSSDGPDTGRRESWSVSYRISVPHRTDLDLETHNGGISIADVDGQVRFEALNGGVHLSDLRGDVRGTTVNGGLHVNLAGSEWEGRGLDVTTTNGGVTLTVPEGYSADLETGTVNGGFDIDFPVTVTGRIGRELRAQLGDGGAPVRVRTTNGGVRIQRR